MSCSSSYDLPSLPESVHFDRAVEFYDRTRWLPPEIEARQTELLMAELAGCVRVLEIGVGTGRIALTLDVPLIGLDLSRPMMEVLRSKSDGVPLVEGDATRLPFPDGCFDAACAAHVFHLIPTWEVAFAELTRVVRPGGVILAVRGSGATDVGREMRAQFLAATGADLVRVGADTIAEVDETAGRSGLRVRVLEIVSHTARRRLDDFATELEAGTWAGIWDLDEGVRRAGAAAVRAWIVERFGSADAEVPVTSSFAWHAYDLP